MQLSDYFSPGEIVHNGQFETLGQSDARSVETLAYCDTIHHLRRADGNPSVSCLITTPQLIEKITATGGIIASADPRNRFFDLHQHLLDNQLLEPEMSFGIGIGCQIHASAQVSDKSRIGDNVIIRENVVIGDYVEIGSHCFVDSGAQLGVEGLLYRSDAQGNKFHLRHQGGVRIGEHSALLCNAVIVRSVHRGLFTSIGNHSIVGISSNIGHEAFLGNNVVVSNNCVVARGAQIQDHGFIGTTVVVREYVTVGQRAKVRSGSVVVSDVAEDTEVSGNFALDHRANLTNYLNAVRQWRQKKS